MAKKKRPRLRSRKKKQSVAMELPTTMAITSQLADVLSWLKETDNPEEHEEYQEMVTMMTTILEKKGDDVIKSMNFKALELANFKTAKEEIDSAYKRLEKDEAGYKRYIKEAMSLLGDKPSIKSRLGTLYLTTKDKLVITNPEKVPNEFKYREMTLRIPEQDWQDYDFSDYDEYRHGDVKGVIKKSELQNHLTNTESVLEYAHLQPTKSLGLRKPTKTQKAKEAEKIK